MRTDLLAYFLLILAFALYKLIEPIWNDIPFVHSYFEDLIAIPVLLKSAQLITAAVVPKKRNYTIPMWDVTIITIGTSIYFEFILPVFDNRFVSDYIDILCYMVGAILFWKVMNKPSHKLATI